MKLVKDGERVTEVATDGFKFMIYNRNQVIYTENRESFKPVAKQIRKEAAAKNNIIEAIWLDIITIPKIVKPG